MEKKDWDLIDSTDWACTCTLGSLHFTLLRGVWGVFLISQIGSSGLSMDQWHDTIRESGGQYGSLRWLNLTHQIKMEGLDDRIEIMLERGMNGIVKNFIRQ